MAPTKHMTTAQAAQQITRENATWGPAVGQPGTVSYGFLGYPESL